MSKVINFLERMGQDSQLRSACAEDFEKAVTDAALDPALQHALVSGNQSELERLLGASVNVCCMIQAVNDDEPAFDEVGQTQAAP